MRPNAIRRDATRSAWVQVGIGAGMLLLPPLALGAVFYSMLAPPDDDAVRPAAADPGPPAVLPATAAPKPEAFPAAGRSAEEQVRSQGQESGQGSSGQSAAPVAFIPAKVVVPLADEGGASPPAAETPVAPVKRPAHRRLRPAQQDSFSLKTWLQQIGILPRNEGVNASAKGG